LVSLQELGQQFQPQAFTTQGSMMISDTPCDHCRFVLYHPIWQYQNSILGLYDDDRFPGGCILRLTQHHESLDELDTSVLNAFMAEIQQTMKVIKQATQTERVNLVILSNTISHIHAHLIP
jgi:diadenosine tetraphosphate (Ap4A) HIT family hydrolase